MWQASLSLCVGQHEPPPPRQHAGLLPESLIWAYIVQLSSALRTIHTAGLACRVMDPSKILITGKTRYTRIQKPEQEFIELIVALVQLITVTINSDRHHWNFLSESLDMSAIFLCHVAQSTYCDTLFSLQVTGELCWGVWCLNFWQQSDESSCPDATVPGTFH